VARANARAALMPSVTRSASGTLRPIEPDRLPNDRDCGRRTSPSRRALEIEKAS
jgi:hypothetical protein